MRKAGCAMIWANATTTGFGKPEVIRFKTRCELMAFVDGLCAGSRHHKE
jgi:hypothetical protein